MRNSTGDARTEARLIASWNSPVLLPPSPITASPKTSSPPRRAAQTPPTTRLNILPRWLIIGKPPPGGVAVMDVALAAVGGALGVGQVLAEQLMGSGPEEQMGGEVAVQQRDHVAARPQRQGSHRGGLVAHAGGHGPLDIALLKQLQEPLLQPPRQAHQRIGDQVQGLAGESPGPANQFGQWQVQSSMRSDGPANAVGSHVPHREPAAAVGSGPHPPGVDRCDERPRNGFRAECRVEERSKIGLYRAGSALSRAAWQAFQGKPGAQLPRWAEGKIRENSHFVQYTYFPRPPQHSSRGFAVIRPSVYVLDCNTGYTLDRKLTCC